MQRILLSILMAASIVGVSFAMSGNVYAGWFGPGEAVWSDEFMGNTWNAQGGYLGSGWNGGVWNGSKLAPSTYPKNNAAWGSVGWGGYGLGAGAGYGGGGFAIQLPGKAPIRIGW